MPRRFYRVAQTHTVPHGDDDPRTRMVRARETTFRA